MGVLTRDELTSEAAIEARKVAEAGERVLLYHLDLPTHASPILYVGPCIEAIEAEGFGLEQMAVTERGGGWFLFRRT